MKVIMKNFQSFLFLWVIVIVLNQLFIFGACFAPYCLIAALPHTGLLSAAIIYFYYKEDEKS